MHTHTSHNILWACLLHQMWQGLLQGKLAWARGACMYDPQEHQPSSWSVFQAAKTALLILLSWRNGLPPHRCWLPGSCFAEGMEGEGVCCMKVGQQTAQNHLATSGDSTTLHTYVVERTGKPQHTRCLEPAPMTHTYSAQHHTDTSRQ